MNPFPADTPAAEVAFWLESSEPAVRAAELLRAGGVPPARVRRLAEIAEGDDAAAVAAWVRAYAEADAREAVRRHHKQ